MAGTVYKITGHIFRNLLFLLFRNNRNDFFRRFRNLSFLPIRVSEIVRMMFRRIGNVLQSRLGIKGVSVEPVKELPRDERVLHRSGIESGLGRKFGEVGKRFRFHLFRSRGSDSIRGRVDVVVDGGGRRRLQLFASFSALPGRGGASD